LRSRSKKQSAQGLNKRRKEIMNKDFTTTEIQSSENAERLQLCNALASLTRRSRITLLNKSQAQLALLILAGTIGADAVRNALDFAEKY